jgi:hypothetical protein
MDAGTRHDRSVLAWAWDHDDLERGTTVSAGAATVRIAAALARHDPARPAEHVRPVRSQRRVLVVPLVRDKRHAQRMEVVGVGGDERSGSLRRRRALMAVRQPRRSLTAAEKIVADRVRRARPAKRDRDGAYHAAICALARKHDRDAAHLLDVWDELVSVRLYQGVTLDDAERESYADMVAIAGIK